MYITSPRFNKLTDQFNIGLAQDMSSLFKDEDETHRAVGKLFCDEVKRIKDENLLGVVELVENKNEN